MFTTEDGTVRNGIQKVSYTHDGMIDVILARPNIQKQQLAEMFDRTPGWISRVTNSDAFKARLEERKAQTTDTLILAAMEDRIGGVAATAFDIIQERLDQIEKLPTRVDDEFVLRAAELSAKALGLGAKQQVNTQTNVAVVVQVPTKIRDAAEWAATHFPAAVIDT